MLNVKVLNGFLSPSSWLSSVCTIGVSSHPSTPTGPHPEQVGRKGLATGRRPGQMPVRLCEQPTLRRRLTVRHAHFRELHPQDQVRRAPRTGGLLFHRPHPQQRGENSQLEPKHSPPGLRSQVHRPMESSWSSLGAIWAKPSRTSTSSMHTFSKCPTSLKYDAPERQREKEHD